jgi:uncharacterized peroxidase-related enzyme
VDAAARNWRTCGVTPRLAALLEYAEKVALTPALSAEDDLRQLRTLGWGDRELHDAVQIVSYFCYINRIADALGVEVEPGARLWGETGSRGAK